MDTPTTKLEALNLMLQAVGESPVSNYDDATTEDAESAKKKLDEVMLEVQAYGYKWNTERSFPLTRDTDGFIDVPTNTLSIIFRTDSSVDPVLRGTRVYDRKSFGYVFTQNLEADIILLLDFEEMPQTARNYVTARATRKFEDVSFGNSEQHRSNSQNELDALVLFKSENALQEMKKYKT